MLSSIQYIDTKIFIISEKSKKKEKRKKKSDMGLLTFRENID